MGSEERRTYCRLCTAYCALWARIENGRVVSVRGDADDPISGGYTCGKGRQTPHQAHGPERLSHTLKRMPDGSFSRIPTQEALDEIAETMRRLIENHGPHSIASFSGTAAFSNSATLPVVRAWHRGIGSPSNYSTLTIDQPAKMVAAARHGIWGGGGHDFESADVILVLGLNPIVSGLTLPGGVPGTNSIRRLENARGRGLKIICIDPRRSELARRSDIHLQPRPGEDATLLAGMVRLIIEEQRFDAAFCAENSEGLEELHEAVAPFDLDYVSARSRIPAEQIVEAARLFATGPRGGTSSGTGADMSAHPRLTAHLLYCLNTLCGRHNREGDRIPNPGVLSAPLPRPAQAIPQELLPPLLSHGDGPESRFRGLRGLFEEMPSATLADEILAPGTQQIRALISVGANPLLSLPNPLEMGKALDSLQLRVAIDIALSPTARRSDYVIAARHAFERDDVTEFMDPFYEVPYAHYAPAIVETEGDAVEDWEVFIGLAGRLGTPIECPGGSIDASNPPNKFELLKLLFPATRIPLERLREASGGRIYDELELRVSPPLPGVDAYLQFAPRGIAEELRELHAERFDEEIDLGYTHRLISRRLPDVLNTVGHDFPTEHPYGGTNPAFLNPADLEARGLESGDLIEIESRHGQIRAVVEASDDLPSGVISMSNGFGDEQLLPENVRRSGSNTGLLIANDANYDAITGMPQLSAIPVRIHASPQAATRGGEPFP